ncbi:C4-dicarboxylate TRAP transporter large permease protein DctM [bioreactor metagenome]|uniref:C4-dicarboxylate TRAP transporter large permease protein DctM n=1 Tax=bioreactor metagenome TaxID=1076179 RepID=A0A644YQ15_9ZZZZ
MATGIMFVVMFGLMFIGVPIAVSLFIALFVLIGLDPVTTANYLAQSLYSGVANFTMLALPFFMVAGAIMETGGLSKRLVNAANAMVGSVTGSLGMVTVIACMFFGAVSGSAPATVAAIGTIMIPMMVREGYNKYYATGLTCVAGGLGIIVPPSYPMVLYGVTCNVSIGDLFIAGLGPALVVGAILMVLNYIYCKKNGLKGRNKFSFSNLGKNVWDAKAALVMPIIILGGIYGGIFTATEAAVVAAVYGILVGLFVYKELKLQKLWRIFKDNAVFIAGTMFVMAPARATGSVFAYLGVNESVSNFIFSVSSNRYIVLTLIFVILFITGMFVQTTPAVVILAPTLLAVVQQVGIHPIHFGMIMVLGLAIAFVTPPVALNLFVGASMTGISIDKITKAAAVFIIGLIAAFFIVAFVPGISMLIVG